MYQKPCSHRIFIYFLIAIFSFVLGWQATSYGLLGDVSVDTEVEERELPSEDSIEDEIDLDLYWTVWEELENKFIHEEALNPEVMVYGSIKGMVDSLGDPYTVFMTPDQSSDFNDSLEGTLEGIGAELTVEDHSLVIVSPLRDSPAEKAGLLPGDIIFEIDGELAAEKTLFDAIMSIRGEKGTTVVLTIIREDLQAPFEVSIVRDSIDLDSITLEKLDNGIVYLSVNQFNDKTDEEFGKAISEMLLDEPVGLIVDLRFNGGGYLDIAVELLSYLLPSNTEAVVIKQRGEEDEIMYTDGNPKILNVPLVVLINEGSASASEIVAGAIQDHKRGILMGTNSFGKGTVQEVDTFSDGSSVRMTIAKWLTPTERDIDEVGIIPDIIVEITEEDIEREYDSQKEAAIEYLLNL
jgi:carboxyl-terminal processing protease